MRSKLHTILFLSAFCFVSAVSLDVMAQDFLEPDTISCWWMMPSATVNVWTT